MKILITPRHICTMIITAIQVSSALAISTVSVEAFRVPVSSLPKNIDPHLGNELDLNKITKQLFENLVSFGTQGYPEPELAKTWVISPLPKSCITFTLNKVKFADGSFVTSQDVKKSIVRSIQMGNSIGAFLKGKCEVKSCSSIEAKGEDNVEFCLGTRSFSGFLKALASNEGSIVKTTPQGLIGTGAFSISQSSPRAITIKRRTPLAFPGINTIEFLSVNEEQGSELFHQGQLHTINSLQFPKTQDIDSHSIFVTQKFLGTMYLGFQMKGSKLKDPALRRALVASFDPDTFHKMNGREGVPAHSFIQPGVLGFAPLPTLLEQNTVQKFPFSQLVVMASKAHEKRKAFQTAIDAQLKKIGLTAEYRFYPFTEAIRRFKNGEGDLIFKGDGVQYYEPASMFVALTSFSNSNISHYRNTQLDELVKKLTLEEDDRIKTQLLSDIDTVLKNDPPLIPLFHPVARIFIRNEVRSSEKNMLSLNHWEFPFHKFVWNERSKR